MFVEVSLSVHPAWHRRLWWHPWKSQWKWHPLLSPHPQSQSSQNAIKLVKCDLPVINLCWLFPFTFLSFLGVASLRIYSHVLGPKFGLANCPFILKMPFSSQLLLLKYKGNVMPMGAFSLQIFLAKTSKECAFSAVPNCHFWCQKLQLSLSQLPDFSMKKTYSCSAFMFSVKICGIWKTESVAWDCTK